MTATATQQVLVNGPRNLVLKYTISGTSGDATAVKLVDISALDASLPATGLRLMRADWALGSFAAKISWDADTDVDIIEMHDGEGDHSWEDAGGIHQNLTAGATGDINFSTSGYGAGGEFGYFLLHFKKKNEGLPVKNLQAVPASASLAISSAAIALADRSSPTAGSVTISSEAPTPA